MPAPDKLILFDDNSQVLTLVGLSQIVSAPGDPIETALVTDADVTATLYDGENNPVTGCIGIALAPVGSPHTGNYSGQVGTSFNPEVGTDYSLSVDAVNGPDTMHLEILVEIQTRRDGGLGATQPIDGSAVTSVNGKSGAVVITATDVNANPGGTNREIQFNNNGVLGGTVFAYSDDGIIKKISISTDAQGSPSSAETLEFGKEGTSGNEYTVIRLRNDQGYITEIYADDLTFTDEDGSTLDVSASGINYRGSGVRSYFRPNSARFTGSIGDNSGATGNDGDVLSKVSGQVAWAPASGGGGGGGASGVQIRKVTYTAAQIKSATPQAAFAAPASGHAISVIQCNFRYRFGTIPYTPHSGATLTMQFVGDVSAAQPILYGPSGPITGFADGTVDRFGYGLPTGLAPLLSLANFTDAVNAVAKAVTVTFTAWMYGLVTALHIVAAGTGYAVGDTLAIVSALSGDSSCLIHVTSVSGGAVTGVAIDTVGNPAYDAASTNSTITVSPQPGSGSGLTIQTDVAAGDGEIDIYFMYTDITL